MQRQNTFPVLALSYLHMTQEGGHDLDIHGSLMASSRSAGALAFGIGASIPIGPDSYCLLYAGFLLRQFKAKLFLSFL